MSHTTKTIEIVVTGTLEMPSVSDVDAIAGKSIEVDLTNAVVVGMVAQLGRVGADVRSGRRREKRTVPSTLRLNIQAEGVVIREVEPAPAPAPTAPELPPAVDPAPPPPPPHPAPLAPERPRGVSQTTAGKVIPRCEPGPCAGTC